MACERRSDTERSRTPERQPTGLGARINGRVSASPAEQPADLGDRARLGGSTKDAAAKAGPTCSWARLPSEGPPRRAARSEHAASSGHRAMTHYAIDWRRRAAGLGRHRVAQ
ncbi:hypothetical protein MTO96_003662 [Rhipicephalus appendiculatus]